VTPCTVVAPRPFGFTLSNLAHSCPFTHGSIFFPLFFLLFCDFSRYGFFFFLPAMELCPRPQSLFIMNFPASPFPEIFSPRVLCFLPSVFLIAGMLTFLTTLEPRIQASLPFPCLPVDRFPLFFFESIRQPAFSLPFLPTPVPLTRPSFFFCFMCSLLEAVLPFPLFSPPKTLENLILSYFARSFSFRKSDLSLSNFS